MTDKDRENIRKYAADLLDALLLDDDDALEEIDSIANCLLEIVNADDD